MTQYVFRFGGGVSDGDDSVRGNKNLLGGKGANLDGMASIGLPVPPGFTMTTELCTLYLAQGQKFDDSVRAEVANGTAHIEDVTGKKFGDAANPLLVSVRSGARVSMPGMMDTVLNLGLNDDTVEGLATSSGDDRFAWDSYRRFIQMYADVVLQLDHGAFEEALEIAKEDKGYFLDTELEVDDLKALVDEYKALVQSEWGKPFPQDVAEQLWGAIGAVFESWDSDRAKVYRRLNNISADWGTAVNVQAMVFGNMGESSATGVAFTRNPSTGENKLYGEFLVNAQGEDVVAGIRTPQDLTEEARIAAGSDAPSLEALMPEAFAEFVATGNKLEAHYKDMQDLEFTIERGKLWMLQTRSGKRTAKAALRIAVEMAGEGVITEEEAVMRVEPSSLDQLLHPTIDPDAEKTVIAMGLPASPGAATGQIVFNSEDAEKLKGEGKQAILVRIETSPEDIHGMYAAEGILTARGGMTSHAAVVARGMGKPCVSGAGGIRIDYQNEELRVPGHTFEKGEVITIDGSTGQVLLGQVAMQRPELSGSFGTLMEWADKLRRMKIRTNAETPADAKSARSFGAEGIGLCRTEHMFFDGERIIAAREMILSDNETDRRAALDKLLPMQRSDFIELFEIMAGLPITIRLLDPPLHEFLPHTEKDIEEVANAMGVDAEKLRQRNLVLQEANPMLGHRGCRLAISYPEIAEMQVRAIIEAAFEAEAKSGSAVEVEIMVPLVGDKKELDFVKDRIDATAKAMFEEKDATVNYLTGTMIELPRAALRAGDIAESAEFFSFGTNDLTQTTFGISRDDASTFLTPYEAKGIIEKDPFISLDIDGVGELVSLAAERGRSTRLGIKLGICGEHGGDPDSIKFCESIGLDYVSCSPFRVPIARLAAAQSAILKA